jgi:hypothetical protein
MLAAAPRRSRASELVENIRASRDLFFKNRRRLFLIVSRSVFEDSFGVLQQASDRQALAPGRSDRQSALARGRRFERAITLANCRAAIGLARDMFFCACTTLLEPGSLFARLSTPFYALISLKLFFSGVCLLDSLAALPNPIATGFVI